MTRPRRRTFRILAATDGSKGADAAVQFAAGLAHHMPHAQVHVVTAGIARRELRFGASGVPFAGTGLGEIEAQERHQGEKVLDAAAARVRKAGARVTTAYLPGRGLQPVAESIVAEAQRVHADLIVAGSEGHGALRQWALGSVALRLMNIAPRAVAIVHPSRPRARRR